MKQIRYKIILMLCLLITLSTVGLAAEQSGTLDERVHEKILDNGLRIVVVERHAAPLFFTLVSFRVGSNHELPDHTGLSHFLEHMLFKGTTKIGTKDYSAEAPIMAELEVVAGRLKELQISLKPWRYELFNEYAAKVKTELPPELREEISGDEAAGWKAVLEKMPKNHEGLPDEWSKTSWLIKDRQQDYWETFRSLLAERARLVELSDQQREFIVQNQLNQIYKTHGSKSQNAFTSYDQTTYMIGLPSNCLELWMYLEADRFQHPVFREFYNERDVIIEERGLRASNPGRKLYQALISTAFKAHPYSRPVIGWESDIKLTNRSDMEGHFNRYYAPNNCQITIVGDVKAKKVFKLAKKYFKSWKRSEVAHEITVQEPEQNGERRVEVEHDSEPRLAMAYHIPTTPHPDAYAMIMIDQIMSMGKTSRLYKSIFIDQGLTGSAPWTSMPPDDRYPNLFAIFATPKAPHTPKEVEEAIFEEIEKLKLEPITQRELERVQNRFKMWQLARLKSNQWLAFILSSAFINGGDWQTISEDVARLMQVTPEEIQNAAQKYFTEKNRTVATLVKPPQSDETGETEAGGLQ